MTPLIKRGNIERSARTLYNSLRYAPEIVRKLGTLAKKYYEAQDEIELLKAEILGLQKTICNNPRIQSLSTTLEIRDRSICELEKQLKQLRCK